MSGDCRYSEPLDRDSNVPALLRQEEATIHIKAHLQPDLRISTSASCEVPPQTGYCANWRRNATLWGRIRQQPERSLGEEWTRSACWCRVNCSERHFPNYIELDTESGELTWHTASDTWIQADRRHDHLVVKLAKERTRPRKPERP